jgi:hypothetical protein
MPPNRIIHVRDVIELIFNEVESKRDLVHLAISSHAFLDPALNKLWSHPSLDTLAKLMSPSAWLIYRNQCPCKECDDLFDDRDVLVGRETLLRCYP